MDEDSKLLTEAYLDQVIKTEEAPADMIRRRTVALNNLQAERDNLARLLDEVLTSLPHKHPWLDPKTENEAWEAIFAIEDQF